MRDFLLKIWKQRIIVIFVIIASTLWFLSRLSYTYTTRIPIDIELTTDYNSNVWIENPRLTIDVTVEADGRLLALYRLGAMPRIGISTSSLTFIPTDNPYQYSIEPASLRRAIQAKESRISVRYITDSLTPVTLSKMSSKRVPLKSNITIVPKRQYMTIGGVRLSFDSLDVKAPQIILDTLQYIPTETLSFTGLTAPIKGNAELMLPSEAYSSKEHVTYNAEITGFTEMQFTLPITAVNAPRRVTATIVPSHTTIKIKVPLGKFSHDIHPRATINYTSTLLPDKRSTLLPVTIDSLPAGAQLIFIEPQFVEPFFNHH